MTDKPATLHLIDGHSITFKAYYAIRGLTGPGGKPTGAVFGFLRILLKFLADYKPDCLAIMFDTGKPTFRSSLYDRYKANREEAPPDFSDQMRWIEKLLDAMQLATFRLDGFEADDLIATMAEHAKKQGREVFILTADKDMFQLVDDKVKMIRPGIDETQLFDPAAVEAKLGIRPDQMVDWLALVGDASDNVPGVPGIGEKTATALLQQYGTLDNLLDHAAELSKPKLRQTLTDNREIALLARKLVTIERHVPFEYALDMCNIPDNLWTPEAIQVASDLGFNQLLKERGITPAQISTLVEPPKKIEARYETICTVEQLERFVASAMKAPWIAIDTETSDTDSMRAKLVGISISDKPGHAVYIPIGHAPHVCREPQLPLEDVRRVLAPLLAGRGPKLSGHHSKFDWKILKRAGFETAPPAFDTMIASYLLDPDKQSGHGLKALGQELLGIPMSPITELIGSGRNQITMVDVDMDQASAYACLDADVTLRLTEHLLPKLENESKLWNVMQEIELPLIPVLMEVELGGFRLDAAALEKLGVELRERLNQLTKDIWEGAGRTFNIASTKQVAQILYEELKLATGKKGKTGYSTAEAELERLANDHPVPRFILEYRGLEKLQSTYIDSLPKLLYTPSGRIHTSFNQTTAATGRLSSTDPNLQNIPIRTELGRAIRRAFVADDPSHLLLKADYSQIELRILAHVTRDPALMAAYRQGLDIHRQTAAQVFGVPQAEVTSRMRAEAKIINFGIIYGMSPHGLAAQLGIGRSQAAEFIDRYFQTYPGVREWVHRLLEEARRTGWVETLAGRRRLVPGLREKNRMVREAAERVAVNTPIQGTCADMIKIAMIRIHRLLPETAPGGRMICQVHDELVFSLPREVFEPAEAMIRHEMTQALPLDVPVVVETGHAPNWAEC